MYEANINQTIMIKSITVNLIQEIEQYENAYGDSYYAESYT